VRARPLALAAAGVALLAALALALVGVAVLDTSSDARADQRRVAASAGDANAQRHARPVGVRIGEAILGIGDERLYADAVSLAKAAGLPEQQEAATLQLRAEAVAILNDVVHGDASAALRAQAANLLGVLLFEDAKIVEQSPRQYLTQALGAFQEAVRLAPDDVVAKANLELLATIPAETRFRKPSPGGAEASASPRAPGGY
jgi:hypothetical protein